MPCVCTVEPYKESQELTSNQDLLDTGIDDYVPPK
jgi:hypothetical protein